MEHLILNLQAPLMYFGVESIDTHSLTRQFPGTSMLTGLLANALGWVRTDHERHHALQENLLYAARIDRESPTAKPLIDFQTAQLGPGIDPFRTSPGQNWVVGWTTRGTPDFRTGGQHTYDSPVLLYRHYIADAHITVALRLKCDEPSSTPNSKRQGVPTLQELATALQQPARPLFIGRKSCIPSCRIYGGFAEGDTALEALMAQPLFENPQRTRPIRAQWQDNDSPEHINPTRRTVISDTLNWQTYLHTGTTIVCEGLIPADLFASHTDKPQPPVT